MQEISGDFSADIKSAQSALRANRPAQLEAEEIRNEDFKSTWDEFGMNALVDGAVPSGEVTKKITEDIIQSVQTSQDYDRQESDYFQAVQATPEQIRVIEESTGADAPPGESINPHPSLDANPDVSISPSDDSEASGTATGTNEAGVNEASSSAQGTNASTSEANVSAPETNTSTPEMNISAPETNISTVTEMNTSTPTMSTSSEIQIYDAILHGELTAPASSGPDIVPPPTEAAPKEPPPAEPAPTEPASTEPIPTP